MIYENYKNVTDTNKALVLNECVHQFIKDTYNEYVDVYMEMQDYLDENNNKIKILCDMPLSVYLRPIDTDLYKKAVYEMCEWISKFLKCSAKFCGSCYCDAGYEITVALDKNIFNMEA